MLSVAKCFFASRTKNKNEEVEISCVVDMLIITAFTYRCLVAVVGIVLFGTVPATATTYTAQACTSTTVSSTGGYILFSNCNSIATTITVSAAAGVSFSSCTFAGISHPLAMVNYALEISGGLLSNSGTNIYFASTVSTLSMNVHSGAVISTTGIFDSIKFQSTLTNAAITFTSSIIKAVSSGSSLWKFNGGISGSSNSFALVNCNASTAGSQGWVASGNVTSLAMSISSTTFTCNAYCISVSSTLSSSTISFVGATVTSTTTEPIYFAGPLSSSTIAMMGGYYAGPTSSLGVVRARNDVINSSLLILGGAHLYGIFPVSFSQTTSCLLSVSGSSYIESPSDYAVSIGDTQSVSANVNIVVDTSSTISGRAAFKFGGNWTSGISITGTGNSVFIAQNTVFYFAQISIINTVTLLLSSVSVTNTLSVGECIRLPSSLKPLGVATVSISSSTLHCEKIVYIDTAGIQTSTSISIMSSSISATLAVLYAPAQVANVNAVLSDCSVSASGGLWRSSSTTVSQQAISLSVISSAITVSGGSLITHIGDASIFSLVITGTSSSRSAISTSSHLFNDKSTSAATLTSLSFTAGYTDLSISGALFSGATGGYLSLLNPSIVLDSTARLSGAGANYYGPITGGSLFVACPSLTGIPSSSTNAFFVFSSLVTSTTMTFQSISFTSSVGLVYMASSSTSASLTITGVSATIASATTASLVGFFSGVHSGMMLSVINSRLSYSLTTSGGAVAPVIIRGATWSGGSTLRSLGNILTSTTAPSVSHVATLLLVNKSTMTSSTISIAKGSFSSSSAVSSNIMYALSSTIVGSALTFQCMSFATAEMPLVYLPLVNTSSVLIESVAAWQASVAGTSAVTITSTSSTAVTVTFMYSYIHLPVLVKPASASSVTSIVVGCSRTSPSYPMSVGSFSSSLRAVVGTASCSRTYQACFDTSSVSHSQSMDMSVSKRSSTVSTTTSKSRSPSHSLSSTVASVSHSSSSSVSAGLPSLSRSASVSPSAFSFSRSRTFSASGQVPENFDVLVDDSSIASQNNSYRLNHGEGFFVADGVPAYAVYLRSSSSSTPDNVSVFSLTLVPRRSNNANESSEHPPARTNMVLTEIDGVVTSSSSASVSSCPYLPCTVELSLFGNISSTHVFIHVIYAGYLSLTRELYLVSNDSTPLTPAYLVFSGNGSDENSSLASSSSSAFAVVGLPMRTLFYIVVLLDRNRKPITPINAATVDITATTTTPLGGAVIANNTATQRVTFASYEALDILTSFVFVGDGNAQLTAGSSIVPQSSSILNVSVVRCSTSTTSKVMSLREFDGDTESMIALFHIPISVMEGSFVCFSGTSSYVNASSYQALSSSALFRSSPCTLTCRRQTAATGSMYTRILLISFHVNEIEEEALTWTDSQMKTRIVASLSLPGDKLLQLRSSRTSLPAAEGQFPWTALNTDAMTICLVLSLVEEDSGTVVDIAAYGATLLLDGATALFDNGSSSYQQQQAGNNTSTTGAPLIPFDVKIFNSSASFWSVCVYHFSFENAATTTGVAAQQIAVSLNFSATGQYSNLTSFTSRLSNVTEYTQTPLHVSCWRNQQSAIVSVVSVSETQDPNFALLTVQFLAAGEGRNASIGPPTVGIANTTTAAIVRFDVVRNDTGSGTILCGLIPVVAQFSTSALVPILITFPLEDGSLTTVIATPPPIAMTSNRMRRLPTVLSLHGCPADAFPSAAGCPRDGSMPVTLVGVDFAVLLSPSSSSSSLRLMWNFTGGDIVVCDDLRVLSESTALCSRYTGGHGRGGHVGFIDINSISADAILVSPSSASLSFDDKNYFLCPTDVSSTECSAHGVCNHVTGMCVCTADADLGYWAGASCNTCASLYNSSVSCTAKCPVDDSGNICSGVGYCTQGQCWCAGAWSSSTCHSCPGFSSPCSGHGQCDYTTGTCRCALHFAGSSCQQCLTSFSGSDCSIRCPTTSLGACNNRGVCQDGVCFCLDPYCGLRCELDGRVDSCLSCSLPSLYGADCTQVCPGSSANPQTPCNGHGLCASGQLGSGLCRCNSGFGSFDCSIACPTTAPGLVCGGHGACDMTTGSCICAAFWATVTCTVPCPVIAGVVCSGHGSCSDGSNGNAACVCDSGYNGLACNVSCLGGDLPCNAHGTCTAKGTCSCYQDTTNGFWSGIMCDSCTSGYVGYSCTAQCPHNASGVPCSGHGACDGKDLLCTCYSSPSLGFWNGAVCDDCAVGYFGSSCVSECPGGACNPCGGNGVCSQGVTGSGACRCGSDPLTGSWGGADCLSCAAGFFGSHCVLVCPKLNGTVCANGVCNDGPSGSGLCTCNAGFDRNVQGHCILCASGYYGPSCSPCPSTSNGTCNGRGVCDDGVDGSGHCRCTGLTGGVLCDKTCPSTLTGVLCDNGLCVNNACVCHTNYSIDPSTLMCSRCVSGKYGQNCNQTCSQCTFGACNRVTGQCECMEGYWGDTCSAQCPGGANNSCSGHGQCDSITGVCACDNSAETGFFVGPACAVCDPMYASDSCRIRCPTYLGQMCNGRGVCFNGRCTDCVPLLREVGFVSMYCGDGCQLRDDNCFPSTCSKGYYGTQCTSLCPGATTLNVNTTCSGRGKCDIAGVCHCEAGYFGDSCSSACPAAMVDGLLRICSGRGSCHAGSCRCLSGYFGAICEIECPGGAATPCSGRGTCANGTCNCLPGAVGVACDRLCPGGIENPCSYNGVCQESGSCSCYQNASRGYFSGTACAQCQGFFTGRGCSISCPPDRGVIRDSACVCLYGFAGVDCSLSCTKSELDASVVCSGHGTCVGDEQCACDVNFYGPTCAVFCTASLCQNQHHLYRAQCNVSTGACECRTSSIGQWAGPLCDTCSTRTWGDECNFICTCSGNGVCDRVSGKCSCFGDPVHGYWSGTQCGACRQGYFGVDCVSINAQITPASSPSGVVSRTTSLGTPAYGWTLQDIDMTLQGSSTEASITILGVSTDGSIAVLNVINCGAVIGTTSGLILNATTILIISVGGAKMFVPRGVHSLLSRKTLSSSITTQAQVQHQKRQRSHQLLAVVDSSSPVYMVGAGGALCSLSWSFGAPDQVECNGNPFSVVSGMSSAAFVGATPLGNTIVIVGPSVDGTLQWVLSRYNVSSGQVLTSRASASTAAGEVLRCTVVDEFRVVCVVFDRARKFLVLHSVDLPTGMVTISQNIIDATLDANATAMGCDVALDVAFVAYNFAKHPSTVLTFRVSTLRLIGTYELAGLFIVTSLQLQTSQLLLLGVIDDGLQSGYISLNVFRIRAVAPNVVDLAGGATVTITGDGFNTSMFYNSTYCILSGVVVPGILVDSQTVTCVSPEAKNSQSACVSESVDLRFGLRQTTQTSVRILRPVSATLLFAVTEYGTLGYGSYDLPTRVTIVGFGFVNSAYAKCRLINKDNQVVFVGAASYVNSTAAVCEQPAPLLPTETFSALQYSHDGTYFGKSTASYSIVGPARGLESERSSSASEHFLLRSSAEVSLGVFRILTTDEYGNRRLALEQRHDAIRCSTNTPDLAIIDAAEAIEVKSSKSVTNSLVDGVATFDNIVLVKPRIGFYSLYCFSSGDTSAVAVVPFQVLPGLPHALGLIVPSSWRSGAVAPALLQPSPSVWVEDVSGNFLADPQQLPSFVRLEFDVYYYDVLTKTATRNVSTIIALADVGGRYHFNDVVTRTPFGTSVTLFFSAHGPTAGSVPEVAVHIAQEICPALSNQYAVNNDFVCRACPDGAICDGTTLLSTADGYWRGSSSSAEAFYPCAPKSSCPLGEGCAGGYSGLVCGACSPGFGRFSSSCEACWPAWVNWLCCVVALFALSAYIFALAFLNIKASTLQEYYDAKAHGLLAKKKSNDGFLKLLQTHFQLLTSIPFAFLPLPSWMQTFFVAAKSGSTASPSGVPFISCTVASNMVEQFYLGLALLPMFLFLGFILCAIVAWILSNPSRKAEEELKRRTQISHGDYRRAERTEHAKRVVEERRTDETYLSKLRGRWAKKATEETTTDKKESFPTTVLLFPEKYNTLGAAKTKGGVGKPRVPSQRKKRSEAMIREEHIALVMQQRGTEGDEEEGHVWTRVLFDSAGDMRRTFHERGHIFQKQRLLSNVDVLARAMDLNDDEKNNLTRHRAELFTGGGPRNSDDDDDDDVFFFDDVMTVDTCLDTEANKVFDSRLREAFIRCMNLFGVTFCSTVALMYPYLIDYSAKMLRTTSLVVDAGHIQVLQADPSIQVDGPFSQSYAILRGVSIAVLVFVAFGAPMMLPLFLKLFASTTCHVPVDETKRNYALGILDECQRRRLVSHSSRKIVVSSSSPVAGEVVVVCEQDPSSSVVPLQPPGGGGEDRSVDYVLSTVHDFATLLDDFNEADRVPGGADMISMTSSREEAPFHKELDDAKIRAKIQDHLDMESHILSMEATSALFTFVSGLYRPDTWWWDCAFLAKQLALSISPLFITELRAQLVYAVVVLQIYIVLNNQVRPWKDRRLFVAESVSLSSLCLTFGLLALLFMDLDDASKTAAIASVAVLNIAVIVIFAGMMIKGSSRRDDDDDDDDDTLQNILKSVRTFFAAHLRHKTREDINVAKEKYQEFCAQKLTSRRLEQLLIRSIRLTTDAIEICRKGERALATKTDTDVQQTHGDITHLTSPFGPLPEVPDIDFSIDPMDVVPEAAVAATSSPRSTVASVTAETAIVCAANRSAWLSMLELVAELHRSVFVLLSIQRYILMETPPSMLRRLSRMVEWLLEDASHSNEVKVGDAVEKNMLAEGRHSEDLLPAEASLATKESREGKKQSLANEAPPAIGTETAAYECDLHGRRRRRSTAAASSALLSSLRKGNELQFDDVWIEGLMSAEVEFLHVYRNLQSAVNAATSRSRSHDRDPLCLT